MPTRREFVLTVSALAAGVLLPRRVWARPFVPRQFPDVPLKPIKLRDNVWAIFEGGGNSLLIATQDGTILIDTKLSKVADELLKNTTELGDGAPKTVINTHHHFDHTGGNSAFTKAELIAHRNLKPRLQNNIDAYLKPAVAQQVEAMRNEGKSEEAQKLLAWSEKVTVADFAPDKEFDAKLDLELGKVPLTLHHFGNGHTDNDAVIQFPDLNIVHMGDLLFHKHHPFIDRPAKANTTGWQNSIRQAMTLCDDKTIVIPGHGEVTDKTALPKQIEYFDQVRTIVEKAIKDGKTKETVAAMKLEQFKDYGFEQLRAVALTAIYEEVSETMH